MKGEIAVRYTIRHFDLPLFTFEANMDSADTGLHIIKVYEENRSFLPLNLTVSEDGVERWLRHRAIPKNRAYVDALLSKVGLSLNRPLGIIAANKGLSLNDCFWVDAEGSGDTFKKVNLYDNRFSQVLAAIAFTGYGSSIRTSLASCPEFSTNGMLPKCWRRQNGKIYLYKGGTSGFSNFGFEPYSELYAYQVAQVMGVNAIRYTLTKDLKKTLCSKCELFTSKEYSYIPIGQLVSKGGIKAIFAYYQTLGQNFVDWLTILLENREFDTSAPLAAEAKEYLMNTFHLDYKSADIIIGYRADDSYFSFASDFINGAISYRQLCNAMRLGKLGQQFVLKSKAAFEQLEFLGYETADSKEWYKKKAFRDQTARRQYFDVERNRRQRGDLYITTILDEEMKPNDPRLR